MTEPPPPLRVRCPCCKRLLYELDDARGASVSYHYCHRCRLRVAVVVVVVVVEDAESPAEGV